MSDFLRELAIGIGFRIDTGTLGSADQMTDQFKANALSADSNVQQLGASMVESGALASAGMGEAVGATSALGSEISGTQGLFGKFKTWGTNAADAVKAKFAEHREQIVQLGDTLKKHRVAIGATFGIAAAVLGASVSTATNFEAAMSRVGAISQATQEEMGLLTDTARELGASTIFSASQVAEGMQYLAMAGFDAQDTLAAMPGLLDTAGAAQADLGSTADIVSNVLSGFNMQASETGRIADVLTATFTSSNTTLGSLGETMKMVAPVASGLGVSIEETAALAGTLGNMGIHGSMAGTSLRTVLASLANPTGEAAKQITNLGISTVDAAGNLLPITNILDQIATKTSHMGDAQRTAFLETLAGRQGVTALTALLDVGASQIDSYTDSLRDSAGVSKDIMARQTDNLQGSLTQLGSAIEGARISIGTAFIPVIRLGANVLTTLVSAFNKLPGPIQTTIAVGLGAITMLSGLALAASFIIPRFGEISAGFTLLKSGFKVITATGAKAGAALTASFWPIALGAAAVVAGVLLVQDIIMGLRGDGDTLTGRAIAWGKEIGPKLSAKIGQFSGALKVAGVVLGAVFGPQLIYTGTIAAVQFGRSVIQAGSGLIGFAAQGARASLGMAKLGAQFLLTGAKQAASFTLGIAKAGAALGAKLLVGLLGVTKAAIGFNLALLANPITWIVVGIAALGGGLYALVKNWDSAKEWATGLWDGLSAGVGSAVSKIGTSLKAGWQATSTWVSNVGDRVRNAGSVIRDGLGSVKGWLGSTIDEFKANPIGFIIDWSPFGLLRRGTESLLGWFGDWLADRGINLPEFSLPTFPDLIGWASVPFDALATWLDSKGIGLPEFSLPTFPDLIAWAKAPFDTFTTWLSEFDIGETIGSAIDSAWGFVTEPLENLTQSIRNWLPFSPAKEGPLSDIDKVGTGLVDTVATGIDDAAGAGALNRALSSALTLPDSDPLSFSGGAAHAPLAGGFNINLNVNVDARGATEEDAEAIGNTTATSIRDVLEQWVAESYYADALGEV